MNSSSYQPRSFNWNAQELLAPIKKSDLQLTPAQTKYFREFFWNDLCAEWDSHNLYNEILKRHLIAPFSDEFMLFNETWYRDEQNHANGFLQLLNLICGEDESELLIQLKSRKTDFKFLENFFADEFELCVLFAYDEYATLQTFRKDTFYQDFGSPLFLEWIRRVRADEATHFMNLVRLIHHNYPHRLAETKNTLLEIMNVEKNLDGYHATFLFDHEDSHFLLTEEELLGECATTVLRRISKSPTANFL